MELQLKNCSGNKDGNDEHEEEERNAKELLEEKEAGKAEAEDKKTTTQVSCKRDLADEWVEKGEIEKVK